MGTGLISGMGYLGYAVLFAVLMSIVTVIFKAVRIGRVKDESKALLITVPEDLNYDEIFNDILKKYTTSYDMVSVKTSNLGSLFKVKYIIDMKKNVSTKAMIDELRVRNGNLEIRISTEEMLDEL